jgi:putative tricarboxylic transport membrane protein
LKLLFAALVGDTVGIIPGEGGAMAGFLSYTIGKEISKNREKFGTGIPEGIILVEGANNASTGGALMTTLLLGIPGSGACAVLLGALMLHGIQPGPMMVFSHLDLVRIIIMSLFVSSFLMFTFTILVSYYVGYFIFMPTKYLVPVITMFCALGAYVMRNSAIDVWIMFVFGWLGYVMRKRGYLPIAFVVGVIIAPIADAELIRTIQIFHGKILETILASPIAIVVLFLNLLLIFFMFRPRRKHG